MNKDKDVFLRGKSASAASCWSLAPSIYLILVRATALLSVFWNKARMRLFISELENSNARGPLPSAHLWRGITAITFNAWKDMSRISTISCCQVSFLPVHDLLEVGPQHDDQLLEGTPLLHIEGYFLLIFLVLVFLSQRDEDQRAFLYEGLAQRVEVLAILRGNILETFRGGVKSSISTWACCHPSCLMGVLLIDEKVPGALGLIYCSTPSTLVSAKILNVGWHIDKTRDKPPASWSWQWLLWWLCWGGCPWLYSRCWRVRRPATPCPAASTDGWPETKHTDRHFVL